MCYKKTFHRLFIAFNVRLLKLKLINFFSFLYPQNGESALHAACLFGHLPVVKMLIRAGADPKLVNQDGATPSELAKKGNHSQVVHYLTQWQIYVH